MQKAYYSLIQFCPDIDRMETVNIGVVLACPERRSGRAVFDARMVGRHARVAGDDPETLRLSVAGFCQRLEQQLADAQSLEDVRSLGISPVSRLRLTAPREMRVEDFETDMRHLVEDLVRPRKVDDFGHHSGHGSRIAAELKQHFESRKISEAIEQDLKVDVPTHHKPWRIPFGYRNGRYRLVQTADFADLKHRKGRNLASELAVAGSFLYKNPDRNRGEQQLIIVGEFRSVNPRNRDSIETILQDNYVALYPFTKEGVESLTADIDSSVRVG